MLNRFKISTKLSGGFFLMVILLIAIWFMGRYSVGQKTYMYGEVEAGHALAKAGFTMQRDLYDTLLSSKDMVMTRNPQHFENVMGKLTTLKTVHEHDLDLLNPEYDQAVLTKMGNVLNGIGAFAGANVQY